MGRVSIEGRKERRGKKSVNLRVNSLSRRTKLITLDARNRRESVKEFEEGRSRERERLFSLESKSEKVKVCENSQDGIVVGIGEGWISLRIILTESANT